MKNVRIKIDKKKDFRECVVVVSELGNAENKKIYNAGDAEKIMCGYPLNIPKPSFSLVDENYEGVEYYNAYCSDSLSSIKIVLLNPKNLDVQKGVVLITNDLNKAFQYCTKLGIDDLDWDQGELPESIQDSLAVGQALSEGVAAGMASTEDLLNAGQVIGDALAGIGEETPVQSTDENA